MSVQVSASLHHPLPELQSTQMQGKEGGWAVDAPQHPADRLELTEEEQREVERLARRDRQVRAHERAHLAAAGHYARAARFDYERGPDGRRYAVGGEVSIDTTPVDQDSEATLRKAQVVRRAALAPVDPSPQDRRVAAQASRMEAQARQEMARQRTVEAEAHGESGGEQVGPTQAGMQARGANPAPTELQESGTVEVPGAAGYGGDSVSRPATVAPAAYGGWGRLTRPVPVHGMVLDLQA